MNYSRNFSLVKNLMKFKWLKTFVPSSCFHKASNLLLPGVFSGDFTYQSLKSHQQTRKCFQVFTSSLKQKIEEYVARGASIYWEEGFLESNRPYWYLKSFGQHGFLCEPINCGWSIYKSEKKWNEPVFVRKGPAWDLVEIYSRKNGTQDLFRLKSNLDSQDLMSLSLYEHLLTQSLLVSVKD